MAMDAPAASPLAKRFAVELEAAVPVGRSVARMGVYGAAFDAAEPALATSSARRRRLADALEELVGAGLIATSSSTDRREGPTLPTEITLLSRGRDPAVGREAATYPWRPELAWAARLRMRRSEFDALKAVQAYLRDREDDSQVVPIGERSLEIFADEKRLAKLSGNNRLFTPERLSLALLRTRHHAPPFAWRRVGDGPVVLVLENQATYHSVIHTRPPDSPVGLVVFGGGGNFASSVAYLAELPADAGVSQPLTEIRYFGDLDRRGLEIPIAANATAQALGLPAVRPAGGLWRLLITHGIRRAHTRVPPNVAEGLVGWLPASLRDAAAGVLVAGERMAQEAVGTALLSRDPAWAGWAELGPPSRADDHAGG